MYDRDQLAAGIRVEMEHTSDPAVAARIAMDHLDEVPDYYSRLEQVETSRTVKAQWIRVLDVVLIGPMMAWGGVALWQRRHPIAGVLLFGLGISTMIYNSRNLVKVERAALALSGRGE